ncbi:hypothetical protein ACP70R_020696 [Stipagrostis hirtigluma subsp. patula]
MGNRVFFAPSRRARRRRQTASCRFRPPMGSLAQPFHDDLPSLRGGLRSDGGLDAISTSYGRGNGTALRLSAVADVEGAALLH